MSVLLASASFGGTIAAVRNLAANDINVGVVSSVRLSAAAWSRNAARTYSAPPEHDSARFIERVLEIGAAEPGQILLASSDDTAWMYSENAARLERHFRLYQPPITTMQRILDKHLFEAAAVRAGVSVLPSWDPQNLEELIALAPDLPYPIVIKPRTHVHRLRNDKGLVAVSPSDLIDRYRRFVAVEQRRAGSTPMMPRAHLPILQQFVDVAAQGVLSVTGFIDRTGSHFVTRRATKVFQRSRPLGVGVCFESLPPDPELSAAVRRLCTELGYFGMFEVEFLWFAGRWNAIDFNPRLFSQVGMDIRRGMPLPLLACLDAAGEAAALAQTVARVEAESDHADVVFCDRFTLQAMLFVLAVTARISPEDRAYWRAWTRRNAAHAVDFSADDTDSVPAVIRAISEIYLGIKSLPRFLRATPRVLPTARGVANGQL